MIANKQLQLAGGTIAAILWLGVNLFTLTAYPPVTCDEVSYSSPAAQFLSTGYWGTQTDAGRDGLDKNAVALGRLFISGIAVSFALLGQSVFAARLVSLVAWALIIVGVFLLGRHLYDYATGRLSALLVAVSWVSLLEGHVARPDMALASGAVWIGYFLCVTLDAPSVLKLIGLGLAAGLLMEIHLNGLHFVLATSVLIGLSALRQRWPWQWLFAFAIGLGCGILIWLWWHIWGVPPVSIPEQLLTTNRESLSLLARFYQTVDFIVQNYLWGGGPGLITGVICMIAVAAALWRRTSSDWRLGGFVAFSFISFVALNAYKPAYYTILWLPLLLVLGARALCMLAANPYWRWPGSVAIKLWLVGATVAGFYIIGDTYLLYKFSDHGFDRMTIQLQNLVEPGSVIFGNPRSWFALPRRTVVDDLALGMVVFRSGQELTEAEIYQLLATTYQPDYLLLGPSLSCYATPTLVAQRLRQVAEANCKQIAVINSAWYEPNTLYHCSFNVAPH